MFLTALLLGILAVALAWPVPVLLARARWPLRAPGSALVAWQAIALAGGLSMIGALAVFGLRPFGVTVRQAGSEAVTWAAHLGTTAAVDIAAVAALSLAALLTVHLVLTLAVTWVHAQRLRHRHRALVTLLGTAGPGGPATRMLDVAAPVAYCLPGGSSMTVVSTGLVRLLDRPELEAVIAHERGHALQRHHLVLVTFRAWHRALPWLPTASLAEDAVARLVELLADDYARHSTDDDVLRRAILRVAPAAGASAVGPADGCRTGSLSQVRAERLAAPGAVLPLRYRSIVVASAVALVCLPPVLLLTQR